MTQTSQFLHRQPTRHRAENVLTTLARDRLIPIAFKRVPVSEVATRVMPWTVVGLVLRIVSGVLLFISGPVRFYGNIFFRIKAVAFVLAGVNAFCFHYSAVGKRIPDWDTSRVTPLGAKAAGWIGMLLWAVIVVCGRFIAYNWFKPLV